jgi:nucleoside 2-deoxyribosyltransferase
MKIYLAHAISGLSYGEVMNYYVKTSEFLKSIGYEVLCPMTGKDALRNETKFKAHGIDKVPLATNHAIIERDRWMVTESDIVYISLVGTKGVSIGSVMEMAWAHQLGKHSILAMEPGNIHEHAFVLEAADIRYESEAEAEEYLARLKNGVLPEGVK